MKAHTVSSNILAILRNTGWSQAGLARKIGVDQSTISKWLNDVSAPDHEKTKTLDTLAQVTSEKGLLLGAGTMATVPEWHFLCARSSINKESQKEHAVETFRLLRSAIRCALRQQDHLCPLNRFGFLFSVVGLSVPFADKSKAFIFADDRQKPRRFVILVNSELNPERQMSEAIAEIGAHIRPYVCNLSTEFLAKDMMIQ